MEGCQKKRFGSTRGIQHSKLFLGPNQSGSSKMALYFVRKAAVEYEARASVKMKESGLKNVKPEPKDHHPRVFTLKFDLLCCDRQFKP